MMLAAAKDAQNSCLANTEALRAAKVLLVGAGGLGCNIAVHLAGAGIGLLGICDFDSVSESNLNRQFIYSQADIGLPKAQAAAEFLSRYAPDCKFVAVNKKITTQNAQEIIEGFSLVVLACDNVAARLAANEACARAGTKLVDSGISGACGRVYVYTPGKSPCLSCIMGADNESADKRTLSAAAGAVGGFAAMAALNALAGGSSACGEMILIDTLNNTIDALPVKKSGECKICGGKQL